MAEVKDRRCDGKETAAGKASTAILVHYGRGVRAPPEWRNFNVSPTWRVRRIPLLGRLLARGHVAFPANVEYGDGTRGPPIKTASAAAVYRSHMLEHLSLDDLSAVLAKTLHTPAGRSLPECRARPRSVCPDFPRRPLFRCGLGLHAADLSRQANASEGGGRFRAGVFRQQRSLVDVGLQEVAGGARRSRISGHPPRAVQGQSSPGVEGVEDDDRWADCLGFECRKQEIHRIRSGCRWRIIKLKF